MVTSEHSRQSCMYPHRVRTQTHTCTWIYKQMHTNQRETDRGGVVRQAERLWKFTWQIIQHRCRDGKKWNALTSISQVQFTGTLLDYFHLLLPLLHYISEANVLVWMDSFKYCLFTYKELKTADHNHHHHHHKVSPVFIRYFSTVTSSEGCVSCVDPNLSQPMAFTADLPKFLACDAKCLKCSSKGLSWENPLAPTCAGRHLFLHTFCKHVVLLHLPLKCVRHVLGNVSSNTMIVLMHLSYWFDAHRSKYYLKCFFLFVISIKLLISQALTFILYSEVDLRGPCRSKYFNFWYTVLKKHALLYT